MNDLIWMSIMILLLGSYYLFGTLDPISNQAHFINEIKEGIDEVKRSTDQYVDSLEKYCKLKSLDSSCSWPWPWPCVSSLSEQQKDRMYQLREYLGLDVSLDANVATSIVRETSEEVVEILSLQLSELEKVLNDINLEEMKKLQKEKSKKELLKEHHEHIKLQIKNKSTELQARGGTLYQMVCDFLLSILMKLINKIIHQFLSELLHI